MIRAVTAQPDGVVRSEGTLPSGNTHVVAGPAPAFSALRLRILPDSNDPKKWPERGSLVTSLAIQLIDASGAATLVPMKAHHLR